MKLATTEEGNALRSIFSMRNAVYVISLFVDSLIGIVPNTSWTIGTMKESVFAILLDSNIIVPMTVDGGRLHTKNYNTILFEE